MDARTRRTHAVTARIVVLCASAIESARLLLASRSVQPMGVGNAHDQVGRYFMEHPIDRVGSVTTDDPLRLIDLFRANGLDKSVTNVWAIEATDRIFAYELRRAPPDTRFFRVEFDLARPVPAPPPPWGADGGPEPNGAR